MASYCNTEDIKAIVDTDMEVAEIQYLIDETDAFMDLKLATGGLSAVIKRGISRTWTAYRVMLKDPASDRIGDLSSNRTANLKGLKAEYMEMIAAAGASSGLAFVVGKAEYIR